MPALAAFYVKNVPYTERFVRAGVGAVAAVAALALLPMPWAVLGAVSGASFVLTGVVGFCPACALVGHKLDATGRRRV